MSALNPLTMECINKTPCGWCVKWDKSCDKKQGNTCSGSNSVDKQPNPNFIPPPTVATVLYGNEDEGKRRDG